MRETGILNRRISDVLSMLGHTDEMIVCDAGFAIPRGVRTVDIALAVDKPTVLETLAELKEHFSVEKVVVADATRDVSPTRFRDVCDAFGKEVPVDVIPLAEFKQRARDVKAVVRTGDFTAYSNVLLVSAVEEDGTWKRLNMNISLLDLVIIVAYLLGIMIVGLWSVRRQKLSGETYFLAGRSLRWPMIGAALFASNISTIHLVGLAASGYNDGLVWGNFEWMATFTLILLGLVFAPFYFQTRISTLPEFLERRYNPTARSFLAFMAILGALFIHIGLSLYAGAAVFEQFFGINVIASIIIISVITAVYTVLGGLKAVMVTEAVQTVLLLCGAVVVTLFAIMALPERADIHNLAQFQAALKPGQLSMLHAKDSAGLAWYAVFLGYRC